VLEKTDTYRMLWNIAVRKLECFGHAVTKVKGRSEKAICAMVPKWRFFASCIFSEARAAHFRHGF